MIQYKLSTISAMINLEITVMNPINIIHFYLREENVKQVYHVQKQLLETVTARQMNKEIKLSDVCHKPLG